jgi:UDP-N-acetylmuramoyl-L-alanyl-D-glutamate--2,6-diaminopimelate ligase
MLKRLLKAVTPGFVLRFYHYVLARLAAIVYKHPSEELIVIGVTGTNGKSSTVTYIGRLLEHMGERVGWTTTANFKIADKEWVNDKKMTMLGRFQTQKLLREMVDAGCTYAIVETSSQGIAQSRHIGINYDMAVFTNLTPEHIESHGGFENYKRAKGVLFDSLHKTGRKIFDGMEVEKAIVVNLDDEHASYYLSHEADRYTGFSLNGSLADASQDSDPWLKLNRMPVVATSIEYTGHCTTFEIDHVGYHLKPIGAFQLKNALAAITCVQELGFRGGSLQRAVESLQAVPGRLEPIDEGQPFKVLVDYAYEPAALQAVYDAIELIEYKRLIHIVGSAGGGRDVARREILGHMSAQHDDIVIVANEDPYDEDPMQIINDVADAAMHAGKKDGVDLFRVLDRQEAIQQAIDLAQADDLVLLTGKGNEPVMAVANGAKVPWDDRVAARKALHNRYGRT